MQRAGGDKINRVLGQPMNWGVWPVLGRQLGFWVNQMNGGKLEFGRSRRLGLDGCGSVGMARKMPEADGLGKLKACWWFVGKAVLKPPQSKRFATVQRHQTARSVWTAARSPPLCGAGQSKATSQYSTGSNEPVLAATRESPALCRFSVCPSREDQTVQPHEA